MCGAAYDPQKSTAPDLFTVTDIPPLGAAFFDVSAGVFFGPIMRDYEEAALFAEWLELTGDNDSRDLLDKLDEFRDLETDWAAGLQSI